MILGCLTLPARILSAVILAGLLYLGWVNRDELRRWVHRQTAEPARPAPSTASPVELTERGRARLDSLARGRVDSVVLDPAEVEAMIVDEMSRRGVGLVDSVEVELQDGGVAVRAQVDPSELPQGSLGPLSEWIKGRQSVEARGPLNLLRVGTGEWRVEEVLIRGIPLPRALRERLLGLVMPGSTASLTFPVDRWITGVRVTPRGAILYGRTER